MWMGAVEKVTEEVLHLNYTLLAVLRFLKFGKHQHLNIFLLFFLKKNFILNPVTLKILLICCCHFEMIAIVKTALTTVYYTPNCP